MKYYLIALNGCGELLKRKFKGGALLDYARKENFDRISGKGKWGYIYLGKTLERAYYGLFDDVKNFPGESFIRARRLGIPVDKGQTSFLAGFMMQVDGRVLETGIELTEKEKSGLLDALSNGKKNFNFHVHDGEVLVVLDREFPNEVITFPMNMKGREFAPHLYRKPECEEINRLVNLSAEVLPAHPINRVREDLGELSANLLWLWGLGSAEELPAYERPGIKTFYLHSYGNSVPPAELLGFRRVADIREIEDNSLIWISSSLNSREGYAVWLRQFEHFDMEILGRILGEYIEGKCRILFIFDGFLSPDAEIRNQWGAFLMLAETSFARFSLKKYFKNGRGFIDRFLT